MYNTIAAIATPNSPAGLAVIRVSGADALSVAQKVFSPLSRKPVASMKGYTAAYGDITDGEYKIDDGVLLVFRAPKSYTGEDTAEITCHGGVYVARRVLRACIRAGAVAAEAGEFTKRAVLNGKMTLTQAESVIDVINAASEQFLLCSNAQKSGALYRRTEEIAEKILGISAHIAAWLDYPDESDEFETSPHLETLNDCQTQLSDLLKSYDTAVSMREGIVTAIVGKPNAGKSTLMNLLTRRERSIVTDIPGTTRDIVEETVNMNGTVLRLCDCAGIRETDDAVEAIGIEYMERQIEQSSLILAVFDSSRPLEEDDCRLIEKVKGKNCICIVNKTDLPAVLDLSVLSVKFDCIIELSAKDPQSLERLAELLGEVCRTDASDLSAGFIANERQRECAVEAERLTQQALEGIKSGTVPLDAVGVTLEHALDALYRLSGKSVSAEIIAEVFKNFCVGK